MIKLIDANGTVHYVRNEDIMHVTLHEQRKHEDGENMIAYYGWVTTNTTQISLSKEGAEMLGEQLENGTIEGVTIDA